VPTSLLFADSLQLRSLVDSAVSMAACASAVGAAAVVCVTPVAIHTQSRTSVSVSKGLTLAASPSKRFSSKLVTKKKSRVTMRYGCCFVVVLFPPLFGSFRRNGIWVIGDGCFTYIVFFAAVEWE
jgi:hypothetical protein